MRASLFFALGTFLILPLTTAFAGEAAAAAGPAPASLGAPLLLHDSEPARELSLPCLGNLCAEDVTSFTNDRVTVTIEGLSRQN